MKLFKRNSVVHNPVGKLATISVPDIKEYLVKEYERSLSLESQVDELNAKLLEAYNYKIKLDAALVTIDEYSKRIVRKEEKISRQNDEIQRMQEEVARVNNELNSYRIRMHDAALTKRELANEIVADTKTAIIEGLNNHKGNLSKASACIIVKNTEPYWEGEVDDE